jgi:HAD superfamily hydrolase (TIGR01509 family)
MTTKSSFGSKQDGNMVKALLFDMDGLLVDSEPLSAKAMDAFLLEYGLVRRDEVQVQLLGRRLPEAIAIVRDSYEMEHPLESLIERYGEMRLVALRGEVRLLPGALEVIEYGRNAGLKLALATSGMRTHAAVSLAETGLVGKFDAEVTGDEVEHGKPAPDLFLLAAKKVCVAPSECVVFEDAPNGVIAARAAGMRVAAVPAVGHKTVFSENPDIVLGSLVEAPAWLMTLGVTVPSLTSP